tara:strand:- start:249 stop:428 length:180 start_codon:yes stop_codon:yes gene_type:complete
VSFFVKRFPGLANAVAVGVETEIDVAADIEEGEDSESLPSEMETAAASFVKKMVNHREN